MIPLICGISKYNKLVNITKRNRLTDVENKLVVTRGEREWGRGKIKRYKLLCIK